MGNKKKPTLKKEISKDLIGDRYFSRRQFIVGAAGHILMLPPLLSLMSESMAQSMMANPHQRISFFFMNYGCLRKFLLPNNAANVLGSDKFTAHETHKHLHYAKLADLGMPVTQPDDDGFTFIDESFADIVEYMNLFAGLDGSGGGHSFGHFCGTTNKAPGNHNRHPNVGKSFDVILEQYYGLSDSALRLHTSGGTKGSHIYDRDADGNFKLKYHQFMGDGDLFNLLFSDVAVENSSAAGESPELNPNKKLVLDAVLADLNRLKNHKRISNNDKILLDQFTTGVQEVEKRSLAGSVAGCSKPNITAHIKAGLDPVTESGAGRVNYDIYLKNIFDMVALGFACNKKQSLFMLNDVINAAGDGLGHHHNGEGVLNNNQGRKWFTKHVANFARTMKAIPDPLDSNGGSILDNSISYIMPYEHNHPSSHWGYGLQAITFGRLGQKTQSGYYFDCRQNHTRSDSLGKNEFGTPLKMFNISLLEGLGIPPSHYLKEGDSFGYGNWTNPEGRYDDFVNIHNNPIPIFYKG